MPSKHPTLAVVIPARNAQQTVAAAVRSAARHAKSGPDVVLVVDDGSTDDTASVASDAGAEVIRHPRSYGAAVARDTGARRAGTDAVAFLDADDRMVEGFPQAVRHTLVERPEASLLMGASVEQRGDGTVRRPPQWNARELAQPLWALAWHNRVPTSAAVVPGWAYKASGGFDPQATRSATAEDWDLWLRLALLGPFAAVGRVGAQRDVRDSSHSRRPEALDAMLQDGLSAVRRLAPRVAEEAPWFARVAAGHVLREAARRSLSAQRPDRALAEGLSALRSNPLDAESWLLTVTAAMPTELRTRLLELHALYQAERSAWLEARWKRGVTP